VLSEVVRDFCGVGSGHGIEKHCMDMMRYKDPDWILTMDGFKANKGKNINNRIFIVVTNAVKKGNAERLPQTGEGMLKRRVIGIDPATGKLDEDPTKSDSSAFLKAADFNAALLWLSKAYYHLKQSNLQRRSGRFRYGGHTLNVTFDNSKNGYKIVAPVAILQGNSDDLVVSYKMDLKFAEIAATIFNIYDKQGGGKKDAGLAHDIIDTVVANVIKQQPVREIVAVFKANQEKGDFLFSMYPA
jgi:hypothetical protein